MRIESLTRTHAHSSQTRMRHRFFAWIGSPTYPHGTTHKPACDTTRTPRSESFTRPITDLCTRLPTQTTNRDQCRVTVARKSQTKKGAVPGPTTQNRPDSHTHSHIHSTRNHQHNPQNGPIAQTRFKVPRNRLTKKGRS